MFNDHSSPNVRNSIVWNNQDSSGTGTISATITNDSSTTTLIHSLVQGSGGSDSWIGGSYVDGGNNIDADPLFITPVDPATAPTTAGDLRLSPGSPAIDAGDNQDVVGVLFDLDDNPRSINGTVDTGAFEASYIYRVAKTGDGTDGLSWSTAYTDVQDALGAAISGDEIWVATGVYTPGATVSDTFQLLYGVALYGGFVATETQRTQRDWEANPTVLSGDIGGDDTTDASGVVTDTANISGENSYHVVIGMGDAVLDGFTITAGDSYEKGYFFHCRCGGGMYNWESSPTLTNVKFSGNSADYGGGMFNSNSFLTMTNVTFSGNKADHGGGTYNYLSITTLTNVTFSGNWASLGGGIYNIYDYASRSSTLTDVTFSGNRGTGGGMYNSSSSPTLTNVNFSGNGGGTYGGGMLNAIRSSPTLTNVTFSGNHSTEGSGMSTWYNSHPIVRNSIFWSNRTVSVFPLYDNIDNFGSSTISITHSLVQGSGGSGNWIGNASYLDGGNNIDADPLFFTPVDPFTAPTTAGDLRLSPGSPAIDAGDNQYVVGVLFDLDGKPRIINGTVDMGAFETFLYLFLPMIFR